MICMNSKVGLIFERSFCPDSIFMDHMVGLNKILNDIQYRVYNNCYRAIEAQYVVCGNYNYNYSNIPLDLKNLSCCIDHFYSADVLKVLPCKQMGHLIMTFSTTINE